ncbi:MAG: GHKL domain-containing protein [Bacteroidales bacterium]|nr:GHKL domain-containing protein [Bacteroidales bacterium]
MEEKTFYAPAARTSKEDIQRQFEAIYSQKFFNEIFGSLTGIGAVIDQNRQIVFANTEFLSLLGFDSIESVLGKRPGEVVSCIHSTDEAAGCGTSVSCAYCGAVNVILESQKTGTKSSKETRITTTVNGKMKSLDLNISSTPIQLSGQTYYAMIFQDISDEKRRFALERIFFHDLLNSAGGLNGLLSLLKEGTNPEEASELINLSEEASREMLEEIMLHRQIRAAENGDLKVNIEPVSSMECIESAIGRIKSHEVGKNKNIKIGSDCTNFYFATDRLLFQRILINLLKNALEATQKEGTVSMGVESQSTRVRFWVKNDAVIPEDIQMQLFQRSFSTKGQGRGIGTYSIKLLTENYLHGKVSFISNETEGTVFSVILNKVFPADLEDSR